MNIMIDTNKRIIYAHAMKASVHEIKSFKSQYPNYAVEMAYSAKYDYGEQVKLFKNLISQL